MLEIILFLTVAGLLVVYAFLPQSKSSQIQEHNSTETPVADSLTVNQFLANLQSEIESSLFPRPTDSVLKRHYDALVVAELENRLAAMPD
ncbi:MAG: hypothetical protein ACXWF8_12535 [Methylobacter sp.]